MIHTSVLSTLGITIEIRLTCEEEGTTYLFAKNQNAQNVKTPPALSRPPMGAKQSPGHEAGVAACWGYTTICFMSLTKLSRSGVVRSSIAAIKPWGLCRVRHALKFVCHTPSQ